MADRPNFPYTQQNLKQALAFAKVPQGILPKAVRIRPWDGGLNLEDPPDILDPKKMPSQRDVFYFKNEVRKPFGGTQVGQTLPTGVQWIGVWEREDGTIVPIAITTLDVYYYIAAVTNAWFLIGNAGAAFATGDLMERWDVTPWLDLLFFVSDNNKLRRWNGPGATHDVVTGGFTARGMYVLNNHLVLLAPRTAGGVLEAQTVRWTVNGNDVFVGTGSGAADLSERGDIIQNGEKLGPFRALIYKTESIVEQRATGDAERPYEFTEIMPGLGLLCPYSLQEWPGGHFFVGNDEQIYNYTGSNLDAIGQEIKSDFFRGLDQTRLRDVVSVYDRRNGEYMVFRPNSASTLNCREYFSFHVQRRRWRSGVYEGTTFASSARTKVTGSTTLRVDRYHVYIATSTKRVYRLDEDVYSFDGAPLEFNAQTIDFIAPEDGVELTFKEFRIGYVVDGLASLTVDASVDGGSTWVGETTAQLGGSASHPLKSGTVQYAHASLLVTGLQVRIRLRNSNPGEKIRIRSVSPVPVLSEESRPEAEQ